MAADVHPDGAIARAAGEDGYAVLVGGAEHARLLDAQGLFALEDEAPEPVMKFIGAHGRLELGRLDRFPDEGVGVQQHVVRKEDVVDADDPVVA